MNNLKVGILKEGKIPVDRRVPLVPFQAREIVNTFPNVKVVAQKSDIRCYKDDDYLNEKIEVVDNVDDCDILMGVKEVPIKNLIEGKTYLFFSHTIKEQSYNRDLLREILSKKIRLIDYELLTDSEGTRVVAFGRYAGLVGAYNGILTYGKRYNLFNIRPAHKCFDLEDLKTEYEKVNLPAIKIAVTGGGRVSRGAMEVLDGMRIRKVTPADYINELYDEPVYTQLNSRDYNKAKDGTEFNRGDFYESPHLYESDFAQFSEVTDLLIAGAYWDPAAPVLFKREDILEPNFKIKVIADITCDIEGSIPSTKKPSTIDDPIYDYNPSEDKIEAALKDESNITVMAVDNLPCELPRDASVDFGKELLNNVLPHLFNKDSEGVIERATIAKDGKLTDRFQYLQNYVDGK
ncbi:NAD(P)-dependent oxidoreductase [Fulvivirga lutea]|uniref:Saccharopine dehydrogenase [NAD(+), L-lysine-forming] n=1 Tax=Fulvivirga lutea TaxID=2810512 RepID=A0A975A1R2_9BACT|nr:NAD(P)-dependent oxidoreductase [Fulvivirga lutea]QSE98601.1 alanine dehydrogenase [Fulvivirga lutea]